MHVLTVWQPWAELLIAGIKPVENRSVFYRAAVGQRIAIHAAKRPVDTAALAYIRSVQGYEPGREMLERMRCQRGVVIGTVKVWNSIHRQGLSWPGQVSWSEADLRWWERGYYGLLCCEPIRFTIPIPWHGRQGLWWIPGFHMEDAEQKMGVRVGW